MTTQISGDTGVSQCQPNSVSQGDIQDGVRLVGGITAPSAGQVGELLTSTGGPVNIGIAAAPSNLAAVTLTPGVWDVQVFGGFTPSASNCYLTDICASTVAGTLQSGISRAANTSTTQGGGTTGFLAGNMGRMVVTSNTTVTCVARAGGPSGTIDCTGTIQARRVA